MCDANKIRRDQIYYQKSSRKYCKESQDQVVEFERRNRRSSPELAFCMILAAFKKGSRIYSMSDLRRLFPSRPNSTVNYLSWTTSSTLWQRRNGARNATSRFHGTRFILFVELPAPPCGSGVDIILVDLQLPPGRSSPDA